VRRSECASDALRSISMLMRADDVSVNSESIRVSLGEPEIAFDPA